ncbi:DUF2523 domain-containing protein [Marinobacterium sp. D7]|uniref:DUF2523 family protein n=1 Tax=Marinobacterium ramblicola TaxID=2849041 RepID=UPI001C2CE1BA|nr:DUF2523 family protein [Marinobacterium ramblicola]MBV1789012.1 DUF2523 domain-containing protein [Marinobacterium ramblicola]
MGEILDAIQGIYDFLTDWNAYSFIQDVFAEVIIWIATWYVWMKVAAIKFLWGVAQALMDNLNISSTLQYYWGQLDSNLLGFCTRYKIPEALNMIMNSAIVSFLMRLF